MNAKKITVTIVAAALFLIAGVFVMGPATVTGYFGGNTAHATPVNAESTAGDEAVAKFNIPDMAIGAEDAPVTIIEYASYTCPHCRDFHATTFEELKHEYIETGKVRFIYREVYFDRYGLWASMIARCGGEEKFFGITEMIYDQQRNWSQGTPYEISENLKRIGIAAGLTQEQVTACMADSDNANALVQWYAHNKEADNIQGTPSFIINGETVKLRSFEQFQTYIEGLL